MGATGCGTFDTAPEQVASQDVRIIAGQQSPQCRALGKVEAQSSLPPDSDLDLVARQRAMVMAKAKGGNAIQVDGLTIRNGQVGEPTTATISAQVFACKFEPDAP